jgi:thymidylate synthase (FAD)
MSEVKLVSVSHSRNIEGVKTAEEFIAYTARVSNPTNQINNETAPKLLAYLVKHSHWSPFEMVNVCIEIKTTRDIGRQILRHRSFSFQEFSQRYAEVNDNFEFREARIQDLKNRQNSLPIDNDSTLSGVWEEIQRKVAIQARDSYNKAIELGIAKEQARAVLPEGMTKSTMYMSGTLRSWIHYCQLRMANGTQLEHQLVAIACWKIITEEFPSLNTLIEHDTEKSAEPVKTGVPEQINKSAFFSMMDEWAQANLPPIPKNWRDAKLPDEKPPAKWDQMGGVPVSSVQ